MSEREAPAWFVARLKTFPDFVEVRYNLAVNRWEFVFRSAAGQAVSQFFGWDKNPLTGEAIPPDPVTGLPPFRDLTPEACRDILASCERTFIGNRADGAGSWKRQIAERARHNRELRVAKARARAAEYAYLIQQVDVRRPGWKLDHPRGCAQPLIIASR